MPGGLAGIVNAAMKTRHPMMNTRIKFNIVYFDRNILKHKWGAYNKNPLEKAGNLVRKIARGSIRRVGQRKGSPVLHSSNNYSKPGRPPF